MKKFFDIKEPEPWEEEWQGMPEFVMDDLTPEKSILVHFKSMEDAKAFGELVGTPVHLSTQSIWFPKAKIGHMVDKRYIQEDSGES